MRLAYGEIDLCAMYRSGGSNLPDTQGEIKLRKFFGALVVLGSMAAASAATTGAMAAPIGLTGPIPNSPYSPPFGAAHIATVISDLDAYLGVTDVCYVGRLGSSGPASTCAGVSAADLSGTGLSGTSGTWTFDPLLTNYEIVAVEINGGSVGELYAVTPAALTGDWNTDDICVGHNKCNHPNLSHIDFYAEAITTAVPEPATVATLGMALMALAFVRLRRSKG